MGCVGWIIIACGYLVSSFECWMINKGLMKNLFHSWLYELACCTGNYENLANKTVGDIWSSGLLPNNWLADICRLCFLFFPWMIRSDDYFLPEWHSSNQTRNINGNCFVSLVAVMGSERLIIWTLVQEKFKLTIIIEMKLCNSMEQPKLSFQMFLKCSLLTITVTVSMTPQFFEGREHPSKIILVQLNLCSI